MKFSYKKPGPIIRFRYWNATSSKVKEKFFIKEAILIGSDAHCDITIHDLEGVQAQIHFKDGVCEDYHRGLKDKVSKNELFQIGNHVFQWRELSLPHLSLAAKVTILGSIASCLAFMVFLGLSSADPTSCRGLAAEFSQPQWRSSIPEIKEALILRQRANEALEKKDYRRALTEIETLVEKTQAYDIGEFCGPRRSISKLKRNYILQLARDDILAGSLRERFSLFNKQWLELLSADREFVQGKLIKLIRKQYLKGYRLAERDESKSEKMIEDCETACEILGLTSDCYRPRTSYQRDAEPS